MPASPFRTTWQLRDHYEILEIPTDATKDEIEDAKRFQILVWHQPSLQNNERAKERVQRIMEAYRTLIDPVMKRRYDATRMPDVDEAQVFTDPVQQRPEVWKRMAAWMKDENVGQPFERKMAFQAGDYLERRRQPSDRQLVWMRKAWDTAIAEGFDPEAEDEE